MTSPKHQCCSVCLVVAAVVCGSVLSQLTVFPGAQDRQPIWLLPGASPALSVMPGPVNVQQIVSIPLVLTGSLTRLEGICSCCIAEF